MDLRSSEIAKQFTDWAERLTPPQGIRGNPKAMQAEWDALLKVLLRYAPSDGYSQWIDGALDRCAMTLKTRAWPTVGELGAACVNHRKETRAFVGTGDEFRPKDACEINADRIRAKEPVGDCWIYGANAVEMVNRGLVSEADLDPYRSGLYFAMKDVWGEEAARARESELQSLHADARRQARIAHRNAAGVSL